MTPLLRSFIAAMSSAAVGAAILPRHALRRAPPCPAGPHPRPAADCTGSRSAGGGSAYILDTADGATYGYRADERFQTLSSFKMLASALVLHRVDRGLESLDRRIPITPADIITWSPVTEKHVGSTGMSLAALCEATITTSDNAAANLILASYGGPAALTAYLRTLGDSVTRIDRREPG